MAVLKGSLNSSTHQKSNGCEKKYQILKKIEEGLMQVDKQSEVVVSILHKLMNEVVKIFHKKNSNCWFFCFSY